MKTKGALSHINVSLAKLNRIFKPDAEIPVPCSFAKALALMQVAIKQQESDELEENEGLSDTQPIEIKEVL